MEGRAIEQNAASSERGKNLARTVGETRVHIPRASGIVTAGGVSQGRNVPVSVEPSPNVTVALVASTTSGFTVAKVVAASKAAGDPRTMSATVISPICGADVLTKGRT